jgi:hypothetical protein
MKMWVRPPPGILMESKVVRFLQPPAKRVAHHECVSITLLSAVKVKREPDFYDKNIIYNRKR